MLETFTDQARHSVALAEDEARLLNHHYLGTEHLLLGLVRAGDSIAARALAALGVSLDTARQEVEKLIGRGLESPSERLFRTPRVTRVLNVLSFRESFQANRKTIGPEHLLLGLVGEAEAVGTLVLAGLGVDADRVRRQVAKLNGP